MNAIKKTRLVGVAALIGGLLVVGTAGAWYGSPWNRPYGAGAMTYERQTMMRRHGHAMDDLSRMFDGRRAFDRAEAVRLAEELESGFGGSLLKNYAPGAVVAGSRTTPWTWRNFGTFRGYTEAARQSAARLAAALEDEPGTDTAKGQGVWMPGGPRAFGPLGFGRDGAIPLTAVQEFGRLNATCLSCHSLFRGGRW